MNESDSASESESDSETADSRAAGSAAIAAGAAQALDISAEIAEAAEIAMGERGRVSVAGSDREDAGTGTGTGTKMQASGRAKTSESESDSETADSRAAGSAAIAAGAAQALDISAEIAEAAEIAMGERGRVSVAGSDREDAGTGTGTGTGTKMQASGRAKTSDSDSDSDSEARPRSHVAISALSASSALSTNAVAGPRESGPATRSAGESPDSDSASPGVPFAWALLALGLLLVSALLPTGPPRWLAGGDTYRWRGLGYLLDEGLLGGGDVTFRQVVTLRRGDELQLVATTSLGAELAIGALYAATLALALVVLRRRAPRALSPGSWRRGALALWDVLVVLFPLVGLGCAGALRFLPRFVGGAELVGAVAGFVQPLLAEPWGALLLGLRFVVLGPLAEEAAWRGVVYLGLRRRLGPVGAGVLSSLAFAAWHLIAGWDLPAALVVQYAFGLAACALVERTGSLWPGFALHALGNALALALYALCMASPETLLALLGV